LTRPWLDTRRAYVCSAIRTIYWNTPKAESSCSAESMLRAILSPRSSMTVKPSRPTRGAGGGRYPNRVGLHGLAGCYNGDSDVDAPRGVS